jgi:type II secretory pathway component PulJ
LKITRSLKASSQGMSLIELMISSALMLIVLYAVTNIYVSTKVTINTQSGVSRMSENAQTSIDLLSRSLRQAAFVGCPSVGETSAGKQRIVRDSLDVTGALPAVQIEEQFMARVFLARSPGTPSQAVANSPVIELVHAATGGAHLRSTMTNRDTSATPMLLTSNPGFQNTPSLGMISHCGIAGGETFVVSQPIVDSGAGWSVQTQSTLRTRYDTDARVYPVQRAQYFVQSVASPTNPSNTTDVLFLRTAEANGTTWGTPVPIVQDVNSLDIFADLDTDVARDYASDESIDFRSLSSTQFHRIVGFQIRLRMNTDETVRGTNGQRIIRDFRPWITIRARAT